MPCATDGQKLQRREPKYSVHKVRRFMRIGNTGRAVTAETLKELDWDLIPASPQTAHMHMAMDEVLLGRVIAGARRPTVRFWEWIEPALVIGSHQSVQNEVDVVAARRLRFTITRRMSGGGTMLCQPGRTITYSLYLPGSAVEGMSFRQSYAALDEWAVRAFNALGVPASYREINDIISPRGKIAGAAQARRRGFVLHHTTIAHAMDVEVLPQLIRVGRERLSERGVRSADKPVSPLSWFTSLTCIETTRHLERFFSDEFGAATSEVSADEMKAAGDLVAEKYATPAWVNRLP
jgi:lipoate-protein ligase A